MAEEKNVFRCSSCNKIIGKGNLSDGRIELKCKCGTVTAIEATPKQVHKESQKQIEVGLQINQLPQLQLGTFSIQHFSE